MTAKVNVLRQVTALPGMSTPKLKQMWQELFDADPPPYDKRFLVKRLTYRLQELSYGGLSEQVEKRIKTLAQDKTKIGQPTANSDDRPVVGTRLIREWKGVDHCVTVLADGFEYLGRPYRSLSAVARAITGTRWNGWTFFGVRRQKSGGNQ